ncbi:hypothetical protein IC757_10055 [Wenzhouxiangella sp. AB-CW3]|uniref:hypothetical protein n=1 Tax=Wenzhouxiangella sp. AB-CW3 TaxID=2771012 RepID=UPI00168AA2E4|nr:hypothetical protein [Wenzhouxiangella sp. AB-CW3]QOC21398.1 hypothetical protein IC757_10055 [Wenzhouxiangella sp. AB-CW3]
MDRFQCVAISLMVIVLSACASTGQQGEAVPEPPLALEARADVPLKAHPAQVTESEHLVETDVRAELAQDLVEFRSRYSVASGELMRNVGKGYRQGQSLPTQIARQSVEHAVRVSTPGRLGAPFRLGFDQQEAAVLTLDGQRREESARAHLAWDPEPLKFQVEWIPPRYKASGNRTLDCSLEGRVQMPTDMISPGFESLLDVSQSDCVVRAPNRGIEELPVQARGLEWRLGDEMGSAIHVNRVETQVARYGLPEDASGYELGFRQQHVVQGWELEADVAMRQAEGRSYQAEVMKDESRWAVDLQLRRQLQRFAMTARWMQTHDPLWFVPEATPIGRESLSLLLDFSDWIEHFVPGMNAGMSASFEHTEDAEGRDDNHVRWDFSLSW